MGTMNGMVHPIMVIGQDKLSFSIVADLLISGHPAILLTSNQHAAEEAIATDVPNTKNLQVITDWPDTIYSQLVVLVTTDSSEVKAETIREVEQRCPKNTIIAVNLESTDLEELQREMLNRERVLGLNWTYPVHRTYFSEIIANPYTDSECIALLEKWVKNYWKKDPYVLHKGFSIRARMMAAMLREGLYLVENGYASIESVDRACRNDAGYYLPFVGNFRYMDLMGTYAYAMVMKDLNRELSNIETLPKTLQEKKEQGHTGLDTGQGFYTYSAEEKAYWHNLFKEFSQEIQQLIADYPHEPLDR